VSSDLFPPSRTPLDGISLIRSLLRVALPPEIELVRDQSPPLAADNAELAAIEAQILALQQRADALRGDDEKKIKVARPQAGSQAERDGGVIEKGGTIYIDFDEDEIE